MSFLADPPLLVAAGAASTRLRSPRARRASEVVVLCVFLGTSISLYFNAGWTRPLWKLGRAESGRDWMLNSGITHFEHGRPRPAVHVLSAGLFVAYPAWYRIGARIATPGGH